MKLTVSKKERGGVITCESGRKYIFLKQDEGQVMVVAAGLMAENVKFDDDTADYSKSRLRQLIEEKILPLFEEDFGSENILEHEVDLTTVDMQKDYGKCSCKVRPITFDEAREFNDLLVDESLPDWYWTCTSWSTPKRGWDSVTLVSPSGDFYDYCSSGIHGVRPFCILKSNIFESTEG